MTAEAHTLPSATQPARSMILGPHPANQLFSISNYYDFLRERLPLLGVSVAGAVPGNGHAGRQATARTWWENYLAWPYQLRKYRADLFHVVDQGLAWYGDHLRGGRRLVTVHDLTAYLNWTGKLGFTRISGRQAQLLRRSMARIREVHHVLSQSRHTADQLMAELGMTAAKITVVPSWVHPVFGVVSDEERTRSRRKLDVGEGPLVLHVGKAVAYKNRIGALKAFARLRERMPRARMVLTSDAATGEETGFLGDASACRVFPALDRAALRELYGAADVMVFPSLYEGFGLPPLEAMACGCPVVSTTGGALGETVGDAALTVEDPHDHAGLASAMERVLREPALRQDLRERGFARARQFQPDTAVARVAEVYRRLL